MPHPVGRRPPVPTPDVDPGFTPPGQPFSGDAGFAAPAPSPGVIQTDQDPGFAPGGSFGRHGVVRPEGVDAQLDRFRKALINEFDREPLPLPPRRNISKGQAIILGLAAAFNPEFGRTFVGPLLKEQIDRPFQERALRQAERDRRVQIGSQIVSTLEAKQKSKQLQAEKDRRFELDTKKFDEQVVVNARNKDLIDKRIEVMDDKLQAEVLTDPRILALKRKADIIQDKLKRFINPLSGQIIKGKEEEARRLAAEEDLVIAQITSLLDDLNVPEIEAEDGGGNPNPGVNEGKDAKPAGSSAPRLVNTLFPNDN